MVVPACPPMTGTLVCKCCLCKCTAATEILIEASDRAMKKHVLQVTAVAQIKEAYLVHIKALGGSDEGTCTAHIEGGDAEELLGVVHTSLLEHLSGDGHSRVDRVGDDEQSSLLNTTRHQRSLRLHEPTDKPGRLVYKCKKGAYQ